MAAEEERGGGAFEGGGGRRRRKRRGGKIGMLDERGARGASGEEVARRQQSEVSATSVRARATPLVHLAEGSAGRAPRRSSPRMRRLLKRRARVQYQHPCC